METIAVDLQPSILAEAQPKHQIRESETYSKNILGPVFFEMSNLKVAGTSMVMAAPEQSPYIVASDEKFVLSVDVEFNQSPLSALLMCLGTRVNICFSLEGIGAKAAEVDVTKLEVTKKGTFKYSISYETTADAAAMTPGLYAIAAVATVGPADHPCSQCVLGYGYIAGVVLQVYPAAGPCVL